MEAKNELISELSILFPGDENLEKLTIVINRYTVARGTDSGRSNLKKRVRQFLTAKKIDGLSSKTLKNYSYNLSLFADRTTKHVTKITTDDIREYIRYLYDERHIKDSSVQTHINTLRSFFLGSETRASLRKTPWPRLKV